MKLLIGSSGTFEVLDAQPVQWPDLAVNAFDPNWGTYIAAASYSGGGACLDTDGDDWTVAAETAIGIDPQDGCADNTSDKAWPADMDNNRVVDVIGDISQVAGQFGKTVPPAPARYDIAPDPTPDRLIDVTRDISRLAGLFGQGCT